MAFLDKVQQAAKVVGEKAGDAVEITKIEAKIMGEKKSMNENLQKLGQYYYDKYIAGTVLDAEAEEICREVTSNKSNIEGYEAEKQRVKLGVDA